MIELTLSSYEMDYEIHVNPWSWILFELNRYKLIYPKLRESEWRFLNFLNGLNRISILFIPKLF